MFQKHQLLEEYRTMENKPVRVSWRIVYRCLQMFTAGLTKVTGVKQCVKMIMRDSLYTVVRISETSATFGFWAKTSKIPAAGEDGSHSLLLLHYEFHCQTIKRIDLHIACVSEV